MKKRIFSILLLCVLLLSAGCAGQRVPAEQVLLALTRGEVGLPPGQIYLSASERHEASYLPSELISALYGKGELPWQLALIEDYGIFLSTAQHPCEFAVFRCYAKSDTDAVAAMCHARLDVLRAHYKGTQYASYTESARVVIMGKHVLLLVSADPQAAQQTAKQVL